jgi:hypothetical protein
MKLFSLLSRTRGIGYLLVITLCVNCKKDNNVSQLSPGSMSQPSGGNLAARDLTQTLSQTKTATRFNYNFEGNLVGNYIGSAGDVAYNDNVYARTKSLATGRGYALLVLGGFGFDIPQVATIKNIIVKARRFETGKGSIKEYYAHLVKNRERPDLPPWWEAYGIRWATPGYFPAIEAEVSYSQSGSGNNGGSGNQPYQWTPARVNDPYFGVLFQLLPPEGGSVVVYYDLVEITVEYSI